MNHTAPPCRWIFLFQQHLQRPAPQITSFSIPTSQSRIKPINPIALRKVKILTAIGLIKFRSLEAQWLKCLPAERPKMEFHCQHCCTQTCYGIKLSSVVFHVVTKIQKMPTVSKVIQYCAFIKATTSFAELQIWRISFFFFLVDNTLDYQSRDCASLVFRMRL